MKEIKQRVLNDFKQVAFELKQLQESARMLSEWVDRLFQDLLANGNVVFEERRNLDDR